MGVRHKCGFSASMAQQTLIYQHLTNIYQFNFFNKNLAYSFTNCLIIAPSLVTTCKMYRALAKFSIFTR